MVSDAFLPPLKLTLDEAMAVVLSARLMVRYADKYDPDLAAAFEKLEAVLPRPLAEHVERTLDILSQHAQDEAFSERVHRLTRAWAERRVVTLAYDPARYATGAVAREAVVRPYLIEPSLQTHALYLIGWDEARGGLRTFKIERITSVSLTPRTFDPPEAGAIEQALRSAWDIIADQPRAEIVLRFDPSVAARVAETTWHPDQRLTPRARRVPRLAGDGQRDDRDPPLDPVVGRHGRSARARGAARGCRGHAGPRGGPLRSRNRCVGAPNGPPLNDPHRTYPPDLG